jgi:asparagine synthase (glutamine-hydrolysing)
VSGLAAIFAPSGAPVDRAMLGEMMRRLAHRGPDRVGYHVADSVALGHCLLAITPEDRHGAQPLERHDRWIVADARIDNREDLGDLLRIDELAKMSDAELILRAYERWGAECPRHLLGDFAFAIWDGVRRELFCARDPIGLKPLFFTQSEDRFMCASEMHALFADPSLPRRPHLRSLALFFTYQYTEREQTLWDRIFALTPAHTLTVRRGTLRQEAYWTPCSGRPVASSPEQRAEQFREVFTEAVRCRLRSAAPVATEVSGGLDSSSVGSVAARLHGEGRTSTPITMMRLGFPGLECDESAFSQAVADRWAMDIKTFYPADEPTLLSPDPTRVARDVYFHPTIVMFDGLIQDARSRGIRTILTGNGSDQLMHRTRVECAGNLSRGRFREAARAIGLSRRTLRAGVREGVVPLLPYALQRPLLRRFRPAPAGWRWLHPRWRSEMRDERESVEGRIANLGGTPETKQIAGRMLWGWEWSQILSVGERHSAGFGIEQRHPFLDLRVIELLLAMPPEERYSRGVVKPILRRAMNGVLPPTVRDRLDKAIPACYVEKCLFSPYWESLTALAGASRLEEAGLADGAAIRQFMREGPRHSNWPAQLISFLALELWYRQPTA